MITTRRYVAFLVIAIAVGLFAFASGCLAPRYQIETRNVKDAVALVLGRVEKYAATAELSPGEGARVAADVATVRDLVAQPAVDQHVLAMPLTRVCDRHDGWVLADTTLNSVERTVFLETTTRLRAVLSAGGP